MHVFEFTYPTLAVAAIYCLWNAYATFQSRQTQVLRQRVAYMLWVTAERAS